MKLFNKLLPYIHRIDAFTPSINQSPETSEHTKSGTSSSEFNELYRLKEERV